MSAPRRPNAHTGRWVAIVAIATVLVTGFAQTTRAPEVEATFPGSNDSLIAFVRGYDIWTIEPDGSHEAMIFSEPPGPISAPRWSPDGRKLVFAHVHGIYVVSADGSEKTLIKSNVASSPDEPAWSPDGTKIVFAQNPSGDEPWSLWMMDADGSDESKIIDMPGGHRPSAVEWSPNGERIAVASTYCCPNDIFSVKPDGTDMKNITNTPELAEITVDWSPDSLSVLTEAIENGPTDTYLVAADGSGSSLLVERGRTPSWSPDGTKIVYTKYGTGGEGTGTQGGLRVANKDGSNPLLITTTSTDQLPAWGGRTPTKIEFTQAIQQLQTIPNLLADLEDDKMPPVPLVAGKPAAVRVYFEEVDAGVTRDVELSGVATRKTTVGLNPGCDVDKRREQKDGCLSADLYFTPPKGEWTATITIKEADVLLDEYEFTMESVAADELALQAVSICDEVTSPGIIPTWECEDATKLNGLAQFLRKIAPTDDVSVTVGGNILRRNAANYTNPRDWWEDIVEDVQNLYSWKDTLAQVIGQQRYYFGMIRPNGPGLLLGRASGIPGRGGAAKSETSTLGMDDSHLTTAHEIGHMMGAKHTNTGAPSGNSTPACYSAAPGNSTDWVYADNNLRSGPLPGEIEVGFDVAAKKALPGDKFFELMGYCNPQWISPRTYITMLNALGGPGASRVSPSGLVDGPFWLVAGEITDEAEFRPLYEIETAGNEGAGSGGYRIEVRTDDSSALFARSFTPIETSARPEPGEEDEPSLIFSELIPVQEGAARIVVIDDSETEIGAIELGGEAPAVTISPIGGAGNAQTIVEVSWSVEDTDSSEHAYWVDYSPDGGETWISQGMGLTDAAVGLATAMLAGSDNAVVRVIASDGVNSGMAVSAPFSVAKKLPEAEIIGPTLNSFRVGDLVWLEGAAWDVDDGTLDDASVTWSSNRDGALGTGVSLPVYDLSEGTHTITMTAKDSDNNEVTDSIVVSVFDAPVFEGETPWAKGDIDCDGDVDSVDALKGLQHTAGIPVVQPGGCPPIGSGDAGAIFGDVDCDDDVDSVDSLSVLRDVAGLAAILPPGCKPIGV